MPPKRQRSAIHVVVGTYLDIPSVTDRYGVYHAFNGPHQYCLAHLIRDFHSFVEEGGDSSQVALELEHELRKSCRIHGSWRKGKISQRQRKLRLSHSKRRFDRLFSDAMAVGSDRLAEFCTRLEDKFDHLWVFASTEGVEPTNNMAERDLRKLVLWRKKSYGTCSAKGQWFVERIASVVETIKKNGANVLDYLEVAIQAFILGQSPPFINGAKSF
jgi:transposase